MLTFIIAIIILLLIFKNWKFILWFGAMVGILLIMLVIGSFLFAWFGFDGDSIFKIILIVLFSLLFLTAVSGLALEKISSTILDIFRR